jgi:hypothetical protein
MVVMKREAGRKKLVRRKTKIIFAHLIILLYSFNPFALKNKKGASAPFLFNHVNQSNPINHGSDIFNHLNPTNHGPI